MFPGLFCTPPSAATASRRPPRRSLPTIRRTTYDARRTDRRMDARRTPHRLGRRRLLRPRAVWFV